MVIDEIYELALLNMSHVCFPPKFNLKGRHCNSASKLKSAALVLGLEPNTGFSMELAGDISVDVAFTRSD